MNQKKDNAILLANIGTSDLEIKIEEYGFLAPWERRQPNKAEDYDQLNDSQKKTWQERYQLVVEKLCPELEVETGNGRFKFVELTKKLNEVYKEEIWEDKINPSRLRGIIETALSRFNLNKIILFVSKQEPIHENDTFYLFKILKRWLENKYSVTVIEKPIPENINLQSDQDDLFEYYHSIFLDYLNSDSTILVSVKGGTGIMQSALSLQSIAMASARSKPLILVDTELHIQRILNGEVSPAKLNSYWKYIRIQKYESVRQLLSRWDFDGVREILKDWKIYINQLIDQQLIDKNKTDQDIIAHKNNLANMIYTLDNAIALFNLDSSGNSSKEIITDTDKVELIENIHQTYDPLLNLYTQCRIFWELNQIANFLSRMSSFCEQMIHHLITELKGNQYFDNQNKRKNWKLNYENNFVQSNQGLYNTFEQLEINTQRTYFNNKNWNFQYNNPSKNKGKKLYKLSNRFSKRNFIEALIKYRKHNKEIDAWKKIAKSLNKLDYWVEKRNQLIHSAEGLSQNSMDNILQDDLKNINSYQGKDKKDINNACQPDEILSELTKIMEHTRTIVGTGNSKYICFNNKCEHYIYSEVRNWINEQLTNSAK